MRQDNGLMSTLSTIFDKRKAEAINNLKRGSEKGVSKIDATSMFESAPSESYELFCVAMSNADILYILPDCVSLLQ